MDSFHAITARDEGSYKLHDDEVQSKLARLEARWEGPYFGGKEIRLIDFVYAAFFLRLQVFREAFGWEPLAQFSKMQEWSRTLLARRTVRDTLPSDFETTVVGFIRSMGGVVTRDSSPRDAKP